MLQINLVSVQINYDFHVSSGPPRFELCFDALSRAWGLIGAIRLVRCAL